MIKSIAVNATPKAKRKGAALVLGQFKDANLDSKSAKLDPTKSASAAARRAEASGVLGAVVQAYPAKGPERVFVVGLGEKDGFGPGRLRAAAASVARAADRAGVETLRVGLETALPKDTDMARAGSAFGEGLGLATWTCNTFRGKATEKKDSRSLAVESLDDSFAAGMKRGLGLATSSGMARTLSQTPPNVATTDYIAEQAKTLCNKYKSLECTVISGARLEKEKLRGLINVGKASENAPCLVRIEYTPAKPDTSLAAAVLVGKTMTYDSGGLSIKTGGSMRGMKRDKDGGCAVFGAMHAVASVIKPARKVVALLSVAENSISDEAYRPDDIIEMRNGVTVEVTNTDAEGRLVLADALCWACDKEKPAFVIDMATLTGGVVVALGNTFAGMWCDDDDLRAKLNDASSRSGERLWRLPHHPEYRQLMKSEVADIVNSAPVRAAHPIQGAAFLSYFVEDGVPWAHIDIAGVHAVDKQTGPYSPGPTGFGTRLLAELLDEAAVDADSAADG